MGSVSIKVEGLPFPASPPNPSLRAHKWVNEEPVAEMPLRIYMYIYIYSAPEAAAGCFLMRMSLALALVQDQAGEEVSCLLLCSVGGSSSGWLQ